MFTIMQKFSDWLISAMNERGWRVWRKTRQDYGRIPGAVAEHDARKYKHDRQIYRLSK